MVLAFMRFALFPESFGVSIEGTEGAHKFRLGDAQGGPARAHRGGIGRFLGPEAPAIVGGAKRAATGQRNRAQTRRAVRYHDADGSAPLAFHAHAMRRSHRLPAI